MTRAVVVDIEGTTSATAFVVSTLFPYARARFGSYLDAHGDESRVRALIEEVRATAQTDDVVGALEAWTDADAKITPLKTLQGWIWLDGFARNELTAHFFPDVVPALEAWHRAGIVLAVFSSGSVDAQRAWFAHTPAGDLAPIISAYFDTDNAGPKRESDSYRKITAALALPAAETLFLSDIRAELDAARAAGWQTAGVRRPGEPAFAAGVGDHRQVASFAEITDLA